MIGWILAGLVGLLTAHTIGNATLLRRPTRRSTVDVKVSVLVPVRNEADRIQACLDSLVRQDGVPHLEIIVLDDGSTDGTAELVQGVRLVHGGPLPPGWLGKPYACHQLAELATGEVLVFVDADVVLAPSAVAAAVHLLDGVDLVSPYPRIVAQGAGRLVQPLLQWSWLTFLPLRAMERSRRASLAAAGGQFLLMRRSAYRAAGGHAAVRDRVLEDIALARAVKRSGGRIALADGSRLATCRMYETWPSLVDGYTKSLWAASGSPWGAALAIGWLLLLYALPPLIAVIAVGLAAWPWAVPATIAYLLAVLGRVVAGRTSLARVWPDALAHPVSIVLLAWLVIRSHRRRQKVTWKGRSVVVR